MFLIELTTESGALYTVNVVNKKIKRTAEGEETKPEWAKYHELRGGSVGTPLEIVWDLDGQTEMKTTTNTITKVIFPEVDV